MQEWGLVPVQGWVLALAGEPRVWAQAREPQVRARAQAREPQVRAKKEIIWNTKKKMGWEKYFQLLMITKYWRI